MTNPVGFGVQKHAEFQTVQPFISNHTEYENIVNRLIADMRSVLEKSPRPISDQVASQFRQRFTCCTCYQDKQDICLMADLCYFMQRIECAAQRKVESREAKASAHETPSDSRDQPVNDGSQQSRIDFFSSQSLGVAVSIDYNRYTQLAQQLINEIQSVNEITESFFERYQLLTLIRVPKLKDLQQRLADVMWNVVGKMPDEKNSRPV